MAVDQAALADRIRELPGLDADEKSALLGLLNTRKKYGLVWEDKPENVEEELREKLPVLKEVAERRILSQEPGAPDHILIEGDNLHALTALQYTHAGKIDVIYIDPPYNTGNRDFIYNDSFVDKEDSWRHSKWLSFMSKRLKLAKHLLKETGVIFISIDDNEQAQLKLLCDEIFGEENFVETIVWKNKYGPGAMTKGFGNIHEYIITYTRRELISIEAELSEDAISQYKLQDENSAIRGPYVTQPLATRSKDDRPNLVYPIVYDGEKIWPDKQWIWSEDRMLEAINKNFLQFNKTKGKWSVRFKQYLKDENGQIRKGKPISIFLGPFNQDGTSELEDIFENRIFNNPKPQALVRKLISMTVNNIDNKHITVLDFFAGSGTTLHATMALNAEDGGSRQCILVTNNENKICEEVTYERNKRVIQGYTNSKGEAVTGLTKNNLRYYRTDFVERSPSMNNRKELTLCAGDLLCIRENCYEPLKKFDGKDKDIRVFNGAESAMVIIFDPRKIEAAVEIIKELPGRCKVYVFSPGHYAFDDEFEEVADKIELCALPEAILQAYNKVLPGRKKRLAAGAAEAGL